MMGAAACVRQAYVSGLKPVSSNQKSVTVAIPLNSSLRKVGSILHESKLIKSEWAFERYVRNKGLSESVQAGTYDLRPSQSTQEIVGILTQGRVATNLVTIYPARRIDEIRSDLINYGFSVADVDAALEPAQYESHPVLADKPHGASLEGYLYPESFQKDSRTTAKDIIEQSLDQMEKHLTADIRAGFVQQGLSLHRGIILTSIVEKEVSKDSDRPIVAQVFLLRMKKDMVLGSDITALYGAIKDDKTPSVAYDSAYNTHLHKDLPPGPVSNVSDSSLKAVANPATTDWLFFVSGDGPDEGKTFFSHTLEEHEKLIKEHCKELCGGQ
jgi:UPF0755 protein